jgi:hypothetical protein
MFPDPRSREPFLRETPPPFYKTREFARFLWLAGMLVVVAGFVVFTTLRDSRTEVPYPPAGTASPAQALPREDPEQRERRILGLFEGSLVDSRNGQGFDETPGYRRMMQILASYAPDDIAQRSTRYLDYAAAMSDPDAWRGEFVRARGIVAGMYAEKLTHPVFGISDVYRAYLTDADGTNGLVVDLPSHPGPFDLQRDPVEVQGIFYRTVSYETQANETREVPYLLARNFGVVATEGERPFRTFLRDRVVLLLSLMALAIVGSRLIVYWMQRRSRRGGDRSPARATDFHAMFEKKMREQGRKTRPPA